MTARKAMAGTPMSPAITTALALEPKEVTDGVVDMESTLAVGPPLVDSPVGTIGPADERSAVMSGRRGQPSWPPRSPGESAMRTSPVAYLTARPPRHYSGLPSGCRRISDDSQESLALPVRCVRNPRVNRCNPRVYARG